MQNKQKIAEKNFTFDGRMSMQVEALANSDRFVLNAFNFKIQSYQVTALDGTNVPINSICKRKLEDNEKTTKVFSAQDDTLQQLSLITNPNGVVSGQIYSINIVYTGLINPYTDGGVYYTSYNDPQGVQQ